MALDNGCNIEENNVNHPRSRCPQEVTNHNTFYYFSFASNMLAEKMRRLDPKAKRVGFGKLINYQLCMSSENSRWKGPAATVVPKDTAFVYGAIWEVDYERMADLDGHEFVLGHQYTPVSLNIETSTGDKIMCRVYVQTRPPNADVNLPISLTYKKVLLKGAHETKLPNTYIDLLRNLENNDTILQDIENEWKLNDVIVA